MEAGFDLGLFGLDMLSGNLARSMAAHDVSVAICPCSAFADQSMEDFAGDGIKIATGLEELARFLKPPRILVLRAPPGPHFQSAFAEALRVMESGDVIIDSSDSWFRDSTQRARSAVDKGIHFLVLGLAPNENLSCPLLMPGGRPEAYHRVGPFFEVATRPVPGGQTTGCLGGCPAGHFIKMTHAAVDNAVTEIVRGIQTLLERGLGAEAGDLLWSKNEDALFDYLRLPVAPSATESGREMGRWAVRIGRELGIPTLTLEASSGARSWKNGEALAEPFCQPHGTLRRDSESLVTMAYGALRVAIIIAYAEGLALMSAASDRLGFHIDIPETLRVWRGGVTLRGPLLEEIQAAFERMPGLANLLFDDDFSEKVMDLQELLRHAVWQADEWNISTPALAAALHYVDTFRDAWLPINLIQPDGFRWAPRSRYASEDALLYAGGEDEDRPAMEQPLE